MTGYQEADLPEASEAYLKAEKAALKRPHMQAVLVSVDTLAALRRAYPNYFLDTVAFIDAVKQAVAESGSA